MYLKESTSGDLVEVLDLAALVDPCRMDTKGRFHAGEEMQDERIFTKQALRFPSGEALPRCWTDKDYRADV